MFVLILGIVDDEDDDI